MKDTPQYYGSLSRFFHWLMAAMFAFMLCTAAMWNINEKYYSLMGYHKSVGFLLLVLLALRLVWALANWRNRPYGSLAVKLGHAALYVLMAAVPVVEPEVRRTRSVRGGTRVMRRARSARTRPSSSPGPMGTSSGRGHAVLSACAPAVALEAGGSPPAASSPRRAKRSARAVRRAATSSGAVPPVRRLRVGGTGTG